MISDRRLFSSRRQSRWKKKNTASIQHLATERRSWAPFWEEGRKQTQQLTEISCVRLFFFFWYHSVLLFDFVPLPTVPTCFCVLGRGKGGIGTKEKHFLGRMGAHFFAVVEKKFTFRWANVRSTSNTILSKCILKFHKSRSTCVQFNAFRLNSEGFLGKCFNNFAHHTLIMLQTTLFSLSLHCPSLIREDET